MATCCGPATVVANHVWTRRIFDDRQFRYCRRRRGTWFGRYGIEFASFYRALGADITVIETLDRIMPSEDAEIAAAAQKAFEKRGVKCRLAATVLRLARSNTGVAAALKSGNASETLEAEVAILAIGIEGNTEQMGLEMLGLDIERGHIVAAENSETNVPGLYAIGDVAGPPRLVHKASHEGIRCVEHIAGVLTAKIRSPIPSCSYAHPQIASVGLTEEQARSRYAAVKVGRYPFRHNGKAIASGVAPPASCWARTCSARRLPS